MQRRALLSTLGAVTIGSLAGCLGSDGGTDPTDTDTPTASPSPTPCPLSGNSKSFTVTGSQCGTGEDSANASVSPTGGSTPDSDGEPQTYTVTVTGTIFGSDSCHTARLVGVELGEQLRVSVKSYVPESKKGQACADCIVDIEYETTVDIQCDYPDTVVVVHNGEQIAEIPLPE